MTTIHDRIEMRISATGKSLRRASLDSGMSQEQVSTLLRNRSMSPTLDTIIKLSVGLETTAEWLAFGIGSQATAIQTQDVSDKPSETARIAPQHDRTYIQASVAALHRLVSEALKIVSIPEAQADAYADAVLELLREQTTSNVVLRLEDERRSDPGFPAIGFDARSSSR